MTEAPLAGPTSPIVLAIGAAAATGIIVIGVVAGPGTVSCIQRGDFAACMSETFFGNGVTQLAESEPTRDGAALAETPDQSPAESRAEPETAGEPAADQGVGADETAISVSEAVLPSFDLVRVEPDGSAVIAGSATPSGEVRIFADDTQIGTETAGPAGDFAFVTEEPIPAGGVELRVLDVETDTYADTSVVVVVQDDRTSEPLVVASEPGEASEILQGLDRPTTSAEAETPAAAEELEAATIAEAEAPEPATIAEAPAAAELEAPANAEDGQPAAPVEVETTTPADAAEPAAVAEAEPQTPAEAQDTEPMAVAEADVEPAATPAEESDAISAAPAPDRDAPAPAEPAAESPGTPAAQTAIIAPAEPAPGAVTPQVEMPSPAELANNEVAPEAPTPAAPAAPMAVAEAEPQQGAVTDAAPDAAAQEPAAAAESVEAAGSAEVEPQAEPETPAETEQVAAAEEPAATQEPAATATPEAEIVRPTIDAVEIDGDRNFFAGAGTDGMTVRLYVDNELVGTTQVVDGRWLVEAIGELDQESQRVRIDMIAEDGTVVGRAEVDFVLDLPEAVEEEIAVADANAAPESVAPAPDAPAAEAPEEAEQSQAPAEPEPAPQPEPMQAPEPAPESQPAQESEPAPAPEPAVEAAPEPEPESAPEPAPEPEPAAEEVPTLVGVTEGDRTTSGLAIIRRGDNLWTIARRVYGEGIRYTQIYEANNDQIRDPDLIYPGQVFDLPDTDQVIGRDEEAAEAAQ